MRPTRRPLNANIVYLITTTPARILFHVRNGITRTEADFRRNS